MPLGIQLLILVNLIFNFIAMLFAKRLCILKGFDPRQSYWALLYPGAAFLLTGIVKSKKEDKSTKAKIFSAISILFGVFLVTIQPFFIYCVLIMPFVGYGTI